MRTLQSLKIDLRELSSKPENRHNRRAAESLARRIRRRLAKRASKNERTGNLAG